VWTLPAGWLGTSVTPSITSTVGTLTGNLTVKAVNGCGTGPVRTLGITAVATVTITGNPASFNFCSQVAPTSAVLMATNGFNAYTWTPSGGNTATATVSTAGTYTVSATNTTYGCTAMKTQQVTNNCAAPTGMINVTITGTTDSVFWAQSQCAVKYSLRISVHGQNTWTTYVISAPASHYKFTGLSLSTQYDWQIETICNSSGTITSAWVPGPTFTTLAQRMEGEEPAALSFNVFPNPANSQVTVAFSTMEEGMYNVKLIDMFGRVVKSESDNAGTGDNIHIMNLDGIAKGVYIIEMEKSGQINKTKLVIQ
jgi:hypothetical protein